MRPRVVQRAAVLMHFSPKFARAVHAGPVRGLVDDERALLTRVDGRAFRTDPERALRLIAALLEEYPVSAAVVGAGALPAFIESSVFENAVLRDRLVADAFGDWLFARAGAVAHLELAVALARRRRRRRGDPGELARGAGVEIARVPAGTLAHFVAAREALGANAHESVARGARVAPAPDASAMEHVLVVDGPAGPDLATCAEPLASLLAFAREGRARAHVVDEAERLGAGDDAAELVDELLSDGLLTVLV